MQKASQHCPTIAVCIGRVTSLEEVVTSFTDDLNSGYRSTNQQHQHHNADNS